MIKMLKQISLIILILLLLNLLNAGQLHAGFGVGPSTVKLNLPPGAEREVKVFVQNSSREGLEYVKAYLESSEENVFGEWKFTGRKAGTMSMLNWVTVTPSEFTLKPGERGSVLVRFKVPVTASGDYRLALMIAQDRDKALQALPDVSEIEDIGDLQLGKHRKAGLPGKYKMRVIQTMRVAVPLYVRVQKGSGSEKEMRPKIKLGKLSMKPADAGKGTLTASLIVSNIGVYEITVRGASSIIHPQSRSTLQITDLSNGALRILPGDKRLLQFNFSGNLPVGSYLAKADLKIKTRNSDALINKSTRQTFRVDAKMAKEMTRLSALGGGDDSRPIVPLIVRPLRVDDSFRGKRIKPLQISVLNPTKKKMVVNPLFRSSIRGKGRPKVTISPKRLNIPAGKSKKVKFTIKPRKKGPVYGNIFFTVKGMKGARPLSVPVMLLPEGTKNRVRGVLAGFKPVLLKGNKELRTMATLSNTGPGHLDGISISVKLKDFLGNPVKESGAKNAKGLLLPGEKTSFYTSFQFADLKDDIYQAEISVRSGNAKELKSTFKFKIDRTTDQIVTAVK